MTPLQGLSRPCKQPEKAMIRLQFSNNLSYRGIGQAAGLSACRKHPQVGA
jgi:hypothetical protein